MRNLVPADVRVARTPRTTGAVLLLDAVGSTSVAARLSVYGTVGAEVMADLLSAVFGPIVEKVHLHGGFVAHFTGDGVVAVFDDTVPRAVRAALAAASQIMEVLGTLGEIDTPTGSVGLTVRAVVGAGSLERHLWRVDELPGRQNAAFVYVGSALEEAQTGEGLVGGGTLGVGPEAALHVPSGMGVRALSDGFVVVDSMLGAGPPLVADTRDSRDSLDGDGWYFFPRSIHDLAVRGEFREVVCVFAALRRLVEVDGTAPMSVVLELAALHHGYVGNVIRPKPDDGGVTALLVWGAPTSHEQDVPRALRFVRDLRERIGSDQVAVGVTRDVVFAGFVGSEVQETYTVVGSGVNLSARMCASAGWEQTVVDPAILDALPAEWVATSIGPVEYKGFAAPIETSLVDAGRSPIQPRPQPFVGRDAELDRLVAACDPLSRGEAAGVIAIVGEAGVGKTRLVDALQRSLADRNPRSQWLCADLDDAYTRPFGVLIDAFADLIGRRGDVDRGDTLGQCFQMLSDEWPDNAAELERSRATFGDLLEVPGDVTAGAALDPESRFENVVMAVETLVIALARTRPVVISISAAEHLDDASAEVLRRVRLDASGVPVLLILQSRGMAAGADADLEIELSPLDRDGIAALIEELAGERASSELLEFLSERTGGNPYFASELFEYMARQESLRPGPGGLELLAKTDDLPAGLRHALIARLDELPGRARRTIQIASVLGRDFDRRVLVMIVGDEKSTISDLDKAERAGLVSASASTDRFVFPHALLRDAAYEMLLSGDLRHAHLEAAQAIRDVSAGADSQADALAHHYDRGEASSEAIHWYIVAADRAAARFANAEALAKLGRALELAADREIERPILQRMEMLYDRLGDRDEQESIIDRLELSTAGHVARQAEVTHLRGKLMSERAEFARASATFRAALDIAATKSVTDTGLLRAVILRDLAEVERRLGHVGEATKLAREAGRRFLAAGATSELATVENLLGGLAWDAGNFHEAARRHQAAVDASRAVDDAIGEVRSLNNLGTALFGRGDISRARSIHEQGVERCRQIGHRTAEASHRDNLGGTAWAVGDYEVAIEHYTQALDIRRRAQDAWGVAISLSNLGAANRGLARLEAAAHYYATALELDRQSERPRGVAYDLHGLGRVRLAEGRLAEAMTFFEEAVALRIELGEIHLANESRSGLAAALLADGRDQAALAEIDAALVSEPSPPFTRCVEPVAALLAAIEVVRAPNPTLAEGLRTASTDWLRATADRIDDSSQRASYLTNVRAHRDLLALTEIESE